MAGKWRSQHDHVRAMWGSETGLKKFAGVRCGVTIQRCEKLYRDDEGCNGSDMIAKMDKT